MKKSSLKKRLTKSILRVLDVCIVGIVSNSEEKKAEVNIEERKDDRSLKKERKKANPEGLKNILTVFDISLDASCVENNRILSVPGLVVDRDENGWYITKKGTGTKIYDSKLESLGYYMKKDILTGDVVFAPQLPLF